MKKAIFIIVSILSLASCGREIHKTADYDRLTHTHQVVAILPVETITTGRIPRNLSPEDIQAIEDGESVAFQISLYNELARRSGRRNKDIKVSIQHYTQTNQLLADAGIEIRDSWNKSPQLLADALGVDAVIRTTVEKEQYLTNLESFGINLARTISIFASNGGWAYSVFPSNHTSVVRISTAVLDSRNGVAVWATDAECPTFWNRSSREVIDSVTRSLARKFPYRM